MGWRDSAISASILDAIFHDTTKASNSSLLARLLTFFSLFHVVLARWSAGLFKHLRTEVWRIDEDEYRESFRREGKGKGRGGGLRGVGDLGYSGSTFFTTANSKFMVKSLERRFEYTFFRDDMLAPYSDHMEQHPSSLLVRITDFLAAPFASIGGALGLAPTHHIIMENILYGKEVDERKEKWETYDLKPEDYFFPERDIAGGALTSEATKERLIDHFEDKIRITKDQFLELKELLEVDTALLQKCNTIDYSLFLVRYPAGSKIPSVGSRTSDWRTGMTSTDGKWQYRIVLLDFFWAKHKTQAKAMTALVNSFNFFADKGPMSITTTPDEYRKRFLGMIDGIVETIG